MSPKKYLIVAKRETTQFTDSVPVPATNSILVKNLTVKPLVVATEDRALIRPWFGNSEQIMISQESRVEFDVELAGSGTAGTAPAFGVLLRGCSFAEVLVAVTSATYNPISTGFEYLTIKCYMDGILGTLLGAHGSVALHMAAKKLPELHFSFIGKYVAVSDAAIPAGADFSAFQTPRPSIPLWTGALTVGGYAAKCAAIDIDMATDVAHAIWMNLETIEPVDRKPKGSIEVQGVTVATKDYWTAVASASDQALSVVHGTAAGNICTVTAPKMHLNGIDLAEFEKTRSFKIPATFDPNAGNDEVVLAFT